MRSYHGPGNVHFFLFTRCHPAQPHCSIDPFVCVNYMTTARACTVVCPAAAKALLLMLH